MAYRPTDPQRSLLESEYLLPTKKRLLLEHSWAVPFRDVILPLVNEELFRDAFKDGGRPNAPIRMLVGLHLLKETNDLTDAQVIENLQFNLLWHCALGLTADAADVCQKTLHNFRQRIIDLGIGERLFNDLVTGLVKKSKLSTAMQRLDSTHVISNMAKLSRLKLLTETVLVFIKALRREQPVHFEALPSQYTERYLDREGYFADAKKDEARRRLGSTSRDLHRLITRFKDIEEVAALDAFQIMQRVFDQQCELVVAQPSGKTEPGASREMVAQPKKPEDVGANSVQSPHDPDATYGHKGKGYEVQIAETCGEDEPFRVITHVSVNGAHESDTHATVPILDALDELGMKPDTLLADTTYSGGENIVAAAERDVDLVAPVQDPKKDEPELDPTTYLKGIVGFAFDTTCHLLLHCTAGHEPYEQQMCGPKLVATFVVTDCEGCPFSAHCPTKRLTSGEREFSQEPKTIATKLRQFDQKQSDFKEQYKLRSGIESVNREMKQRHGLAKPRVRGGPKMELAVRLKAMAVNAKRAVEYYARLARDAGNLAPVMA